jgi:hypothetical protein
MSHRSHALALAGAALLSMHVGGAAAQSVYVAPGGIYIAPGAGPVYVTPPAPRWRVRALAGLDEDSAQGLNAVF